MGPYTLLGGARVMRSWQIVLSWENLKAYHISESIGAGTIEFKLKEEGDFLYCSFLLSVLAIRQE